MPIKPVPEEDIHESSHSGPQLNGPATDRVTARPVRQANYQEVSYKAGEVENGFEYGGWRASNK